MAEINFEVKITGDLEGKLKELAEERWQVYYSALHAPFVEFGTKPHFPPFDPIFKWCRRKLGLSDKEAAIAAKAIQWHIYHHGSEPDPYLRPAIDRAKAFIQKDFAEGGIERVAERIFNISQEIILEKGITDTGVLLKSGGYRKVD